MKLFTISLALLLSINLYSQHIEKKDLTIISKLLTEPRIVSNIEKSLEQEKLDLVLEDGTRLYSNSTENSPTVVQIKKIKPLGNGYYKLKVRVNEDLLITSKIWYSDCSSELLVHSLYIRDSNWLFKDGEFYLWVFHS